MINIYEATCNALETLGYPVSKQDGYKEGDSLPDTFLTYFLVADINETHYDNKTASTTYKVRVAMYSRDPAIAQHADSIIRGAMLPAGFLRAGGRDLPTDPDTGHECYSVDYKYFDMEGF